MHQAERSIRETYNAGERPQRQVSVVRATGRREDWGVIGFKKRKKMVSESAGSSGRRHCATACGVSAEAFPTFLRARSRALAHFVLLMFVLFFGF